MSRMVQKKLRNQKGFTLIELLAVIVILGIIAAIAIPSILGLIDNSKKDAHVANAQQMISSAKMAIANNPQLQTGTQYITLEYLQTANYIETIKDPDNQSGTYKVGTATTIDSLTEEPTTQVSYVVAVNGSVTKVKLVGSKRGIQTTDDAPVDLTTTTLSRSNVN